MKCTLLKFGVFLFFFFYFWQHLPTDYNVKFELLFTKALPIEQIFCPIYSAQGIVLRKQGECREVEQAQIMAEMPMGHSSEQEQQGVS